jgi:two-component system NtrC family response regulator
LAAAERDFILRTLEHTKGKKAPAARLLGIDIKTLSRKLREYLAQD